VGLEKEEDRLERLARDFANVLGSDKTVSQVALSYQLNPLPELCVSSLQNGLSSRMPPPSTLIPSIRSTPS
jgi:hypothetical protein